MVVLGALAYQFNLHDEHWFSLTLELGCIGALFFASYFLLTFATHGLGNVRLADSITFLHCYHACLLLFRDAFPPILIICHTSVPWHSCEDMHLSGRSY